ncbi:MAG: porphobilinogen synthase [Chthoniobacterales bacterium]|nr:porphobilinogen synthase [Chthoniobacterales bacterium]
MSNIPFSLNLSRRMRRNRSAAAIRGLLQETKLHQEDFIQPLFFHDGQGGAKEIDSMPGIVRHSLATLLEECHQLVDLGLSAVALFPCIDPAKKDLLGAHGLDSENVLYRAIRKIKKTFPDLLIITDVALDPYTSHGHDGLLNEQGRVENDATVEILMRLALLEAEAGADIVAPSDMMDGRVKAIRSTLDGKGFQETAILAYSAKYASAYYGPFRQAVGSEKKTAPVDKQTYQMNPANLREALLEVKLDEEEGADMVMVKPAGPYLDVIRAVREVTLLPVVAYQVSGEYAQICAAARLGWLDYKSTRDEALLAIKRAGATMILSYFSKEVLTVLKS